jgi:protein-tyrosine phosphatase
MKGGTLMSKIKCAVDLTKLEFVDTHTHILPHMDDGSRSCDQSIEMMRMLRNQGVVALIASSHFYPENESPRSFLSRRDRALKSLYEKIKHHQEKLPRIYIGAEVAYFDGISTSEEVALLKIEGTDLLLVELPFRRWGHSVVEEICDLIEKRGIIPIIAHVERYFYYCRDSMIRYLAQKGAIIQINASALTSVKTRRRTLRLLKQGAITLIGTDCHNTDTRAPNMSDAIQIIERQLGIAKLRELEQKGKALLENACIAVDDAKRE